MTTPISQSNIQTAVTAWFDNPAAALQTYGDISTWDVSAVTNMSNLFQGRSGLEPSALTGWDVSQVTSMNRMFLGYGPFDLDLSGWDVASVDDFSLMFWSVHGFANVPAWDSPDEPSPFCWINISSQANMENMFVQESLFPQVIRNPSCPDWTPAVLTNDLLRQAVQDWVYFSPSNTQFAYYKWGDISTLDTSQVTNMDELFSQCRVGFDVSGWDTGNVRSMERTFWRCEMQFTGLEDWNVGQVRSMKEMFAESNNFNNDLSTWNTQNVRSMRSMFELTNSFDADISGWNTFLVKDFSRMFYRATAFRSSNLSNWDLSSAEDVSLIFGGDSVYSMVLCWDLPISAVFAVPIQDNFGQGTSAAFMDSSCPNWPLPLGDSNIHRAAQAFMDQKTQEIYGGSASGPDFFDLYGPIEDWDVSKVTDMSQLFVHNGYTWEYGDVDLSNWNIENVKDFSEMFFLAKNLNFDLNQWNPMSAEMLDGIFFGACDMEDTLCSWRDALPTQTQLIDAFLKRLPDPSCPTCDAVENDYCTPAINRFLQTSPLVCVVCPICEEDSRINEWATKKPFESLGSPLWPQFFPISNRYQTYSQMTCQSIDDNSALVLLDSFWGPGINQTMLAESRPPEDLCQAVQVAYGGMGVKGQCCQSDLVDSEEPPCGICPPNGKPSEPPFADEYLVEGFTCSFLDVQQDIAYRSMKQWEGRQQNTCTATLRLPEGETSTVEGDISISRQQGQGTAFIEVELLPSAEVLEDFQAKCCNLTNLTETADPGSGDVEDPDSGAKQFDPIDASTQLSLLTMAIFSFWFAI